MASSSRARRAFTLVEVLVAAAVFAVLMYVIWDMFVGGIRAFQREEGKTESLEAAVLAYDTIANDLRQQMYFGVTHDKLASTPPVTISPDGRAITFFTFVDLNHQDSHVPQAWVSPVTFELADSGKPDFKYLKRNDEVHKTIKLSDVAFELKQGQRADGKPLFFVSLRITGYGERDRDHTLIIGLIALDACNLRNIHPYWAQTPGMIDAGRGLMSEGF